MTGCDTPKMASNLAYEGLLFGVRVAGPRLQGETTGLCEAGDPDPNFGGNVLHNVRRPTSRQVYAPNKCQPMNKTLSKYLHKNSHRHSEYRIAQRPYRAGLRRRYSPHAASSTPGSRRYRKETTSEETCDMGKRPNSENKTYVCRVCSSTWLAAACNRPWEVNIESSPTWSHPREANSNRSPATTVRHALILLDNAEARRPLTSVHSRAIGCELTARWCELTVMRCDLTAMWCELTAIWCDLTAMWCELTAMWCELTAVWCELIGMSCELTAMCGQQRREQPRAQ
jgi:hypothetical protein